MAIFSTLTNRVYICEVFFKDNYRPAIILHSVDKGPFEAAQALLEWTRSAPNSSASTVGRRTC